MHSNRQHQRHGPIHMREHTHTVALQLHMTCTINPHMEEWQEPITGVWLNEWSLMAGSKGLECTHTIVNQNEKLKLNQTSKPLRFQFLNFSQKVSRLFDCGVIKASPISTLFSFSLSLSLSPFHLKFPILHFFLHTHAPLFSNTHTCFLLRFQKGPIITMGLSLRTLSLYTGMHTLTHTHT